MNTSTQLQSHKVCQYDRTWKSQNTRRYIQKERQELVSYLYI